MNPVSTWVGIMVATEGEILDFSTPKSPENASSGIFMYLKLVWKYYSFAVFKPILCKTYDESLQKQAVHMDLQCVIYIASSSYAVKTPKDEGTWHTYWNFYKNWKIGHVSLKTGDFENKREDGREPLKTRVSRSKREGWNIYIKILNLHPHA